VTGHQCHHPVLRLTAYVSGPDDLTPTIYISRVKPHLWLLIPGPPRQQGHWKPQSQAWLSKWKATIDQKPQWNAPCNRL